MSREPENRSDSAPSGDITRLLAESAGGDSEAQTQLLEAVYRELHRMARARMRGEREGHTLSATALVNEAYIKLFRDLVEEGLVPGFADTRGFFRAAAAAMRRILIDHARSKKTLKRAGKDPGAQRRIPLDLLAASETADAADLMALDEAISRLEAVDERAAEVVRLRFFAGQEIETVAELLEVSSRTVKRDWEFARAWLQQVLEETPPDRDGDGDGDAGG